MALQPRIIACGTKKAAMGMTIRFLCGPLVMSASSIAIGLRRDKLHTAIVQVPCYICGMNLHLRTHEAHGNWSSYLYLYATNIISYINVSKRKINFLLYISGHQIKLMSYMILNFTIICFPGCSSTRDSAICVCKGIWAAS